MPGPRQSPQTARSPPCSGGPCEGFVACGADCLSAPALASDRLRYNNSALKVITYNILEGGTGRIDPLAEVIRLSGADIVVLEETWDEALFHKLADRLGMDRFLASNPRNPEGSVGLLTRWTIR